ncbi:MAG: malonyl-[acyl-carrier protein] O-methyltransferase BioC [Candidatus Makaraimicrobium thalassicum]|nr:MAG: malonyl-[acyl-carrier protein] O-methyltransferase BioC [Candidatus Omnitrophota bacterium]
MDKRIINGNFSKNAKSYDDHAAVQSRCAERLIELIRGERFSRILEIGCGTGIYTRLLRDKYGDAEMTALDISEDMIGVARKKFPAGDVSFRVADGEQMAMDGKADLITSNASFQWFEDLCGTLELFAEALADGGVLCFSMYGPETFKEFRDVLESHFGRHRRLSSSRFICREEMEIILAKYFKRFELAEERFTADFSSIWDFLRDVKHSGSRGEGLENDLFLGRDAIREMEKTYIEKFNRIVATHHVYFCKARKVG